MTHPLAPAVRALLNELTLGDDPCLFLSAGVDSNCLLGGLLANGYKPTVVSVRLKGVWSRDFRHAFGAASHHGLDFVEVVMPSDPDWLAERVRWVIDTMNYTSKSNIECAIPIALCVDAARDAGAKTIYRGVGPDTTFALSRKGYVGANAGGADDPDWLRAYQDAGFAKGDISQQVGLSAYAESMGMTLAAPFLDPRFRQLFNGWTWNQLNKPREKMPLRHAYKEANVRYPHTNLQLGDSGIADAFARLVDSRHNRHGYKSVVGIYNDIARQRYEA